MERLLRNGLAVLVLVAAQIAAAQNSLPPIPWRTVGEGTASKIEKAQNRFLHTSGDLQKWWREHAGEGGTVPYKIDFNRDFAVAIHLGEKATGGHSVYVETVARTTAAGAVIAVVEKQPRRGSMTTQALTQPWVLVAIQRSGVVDWQFKSRVVTERPPSAGCGCCSKCQAGTATTIYYDPTPIGSFSIDNPNGVRPLGSVPFAPFDTGDFSGIRRPEHSVIRTEREFDLYWGRHRPEDDLAPDSRVDWRREQLLALHVGSVPTTGYRIEIVEIERTWYGTLNVKYALRTPEPGERVRNITTSPYVVVRMSRITEPINLVRRDDLASGVCACCAKCKGR